MIPASLQADSIFKTVSLSREAFEKRLTNGNNDFTEAVSFHHGKPDATNLPNEDVSVWLHLNEFIPDEEDQPFGAEALIGSWTIWIYAQDRGDDQFGIDPDLGDKMAGQILESLFSELGDTNLDGAVEEINFRGAVSEVGTNAAGDRRIHSWEATVEATHPLQPVRCPT